ncbi:DUF4880 domain-containing protein [Acinetobacter qingfengensis]|uniref:Uncharacterized protein n=1 Tax=Acinetobacter qingfengensis TaxID=1262585 RepID=A0A1E7RDB1_9GAMM|nr:FecR domain-containing protein [Acinetobacter qingfengensis]KAA8732357.1 DUF4880 domain-containing protein [Acinetobacter qingfengensis]OEY97266.1 hypothetical protein BJI46_02270 [Acinetobacter qingfengensis]
MKRQKRQKQQILEQASQWLTRLQEGNLSDEEKKQLLNWQNQSPYHQKIWKTALDLHHKLSELPQDVTLPVIHKLRKEQTTSYKKYVWLLAALPVLSAIYYGNEQQQWLADYRSPVGQQTTVHLPDGGKIILNGLSAIDVDYSQQQRTIILRKGEIWIETHPDQLKRPFIVQTKQGSAQALGTQYLVRMEAQQSFVAVNKGAVKITTLNSKQSKILHSHQQTYFSQYTLNTPQNIDMAEIAWTKGFIMVNDLPLQQFIQRLKPYQKGIIHIDPAIASIKISGTYPIHDLDGIYSMLAHTYALDIHDYANHYFIHIKAK